MKRLHAVGSWKMLLPFQPVRSTDIKTKMLRIYNICSYAIWLLDFNSQTPAGQIPAEARAKVEILSDMLFDEEGGD